MYVLSISPKAFMIISGGSVSITPNYLEATQYERIGDAMKAAALVNYSLESFMVKVKPLYLLLQRSINHSKDFSLNDTSVSSNL